METASSDRPFRLASGRFVHLATHTVARLMVLAAVLLVVILAGLTLTPSALAGSGDFVINGRGNGHGAGLSQWGAWAAAREGVSYKKILAFYYPGTRLTSLSDPGRLVKVRITRTADSHDGYYRVDLKPTVTSAKLVMHRSSGESVRALSAGSSVTVTYSAGKVKVSGTSGTFDWVEMRPASTSGRVALAVRRSSSSSATKIEYWGTVRVERNGRNTSLRVYNTVLLERYLRGVAEVDPGWANSRLRSQYAPEAVKAQQVAARTYAVYRSRSPYLYDNALDQMYLGYTWEAAHPGVRAAVEATKGLVLTRGGRAIGACYSSSSGGYLTDTAWSNSGAPSYIVAKADPWSLKAPRSPWSIKAGYTWACTISPASLKAKLKGVVSVGTITKVEVVSRDTSSAGSHATALRITGTAGKATISARTFRAKLGLRSTLIVSITGGKGGATGSGSTGGSGNSGAASGANRYESGDYRLAYRGSWGVFMVGSASAGGYKRVNTNGGSITATFRGTSLTWIATKGRTMGAAYVSVDGKTAVKVDLARSSVAYQQRVWSTGTLSSGVHTVKVWWYSGNKTGKYINVDAFEVKGTLR
jgi:stage II sporulation protein D